MTLRLSRRSVLLGAVASTMFGCTRPPRIVDGHDGQGPLPGSALRLLTWNVFMMPQWTNESPFNEERAAAIAAVLLDADCDILCLQKVFDDDARAVLERKLAERYPHRYGPANEVCPRPILSSGVWVLSRRALHGYREIAFDACGEVECLSRKGAVLLGGEHCGAPFQLIATHLQGEEGDEYAIFNERVRASQLEAIRTQLIEPFAKPGTPIFVCGDLNTPRFTTRYHRTSPSYLAMLKGLGVENGAEERVTLVDDSCENQLAVDRKGRRAELDYILVRPNGSEVRIRRDRHVFRRGGWDSSPQARVDLSYRYAVTADVQLATP